MIQCDGQISIFDLVEQPAQTNLDNVGIGALFQPGDWIEKVNVGEQLTFDEITQMIDQLIVMDKSTASHAWYKVVMVEKIVMVENNTQRRLVYYDGVKQRGMVNEMYFDETMRFPTRAYRLKA